VLEKAAMFVRAIQSAARELEQSEPKVSGASGRLH
jgi:hypothetical protein